MEREGERNPERKGKGEREREKNSDSRQDADRIRGNREEGGDGARRERGYVEGLGEGETRQRQKRLQEEWGGLRRGCRGPRAVSTTPNPRRTLALCVSLSLSLSLSSALTTASTPMTSKRFHAHTRPFLSLALARRLVTAGRVHGRSETSADLRSRRLGSLMALVGSRSTR